MASDGSNFKTEPKLLNENHFQNLNQITKELFNCLITFTCCFIQLVDFCFICIFKIFNKCE